MPALINIEAVWRKVEIFSVYQLIAGEIQVRGRFQPTLNDPEPYATLHNVVTTPMLPGAPRLQSIAEGYVQKDLLGVIRPVEPEPPSADDAGIELTKRFLYFQGTTFTVKASAQFPVAAEPKQHREMLFKSKFFPVTDATLTVVGAELAPLLWPQCYVNRDLMIALYMG